MSPAGNWDVGFMGTVAGGARSSSGLSPRVLPLGTAEVANTTPLLSHVHPSRWPTKPKLPGTATRSIARVQRGILPSESQFSLEYSEDSSPSESCFPKPPQRCSPAVLAAELLKKSRF